jgi:hypothetical protein
MDAVLRWQMQNPSTSGPSQSAMTFALLPCAALQDALARACVLCRQRQMPGQFWQPRAATLLHSWTLCQSQWHALLKVALLPGVAGVWVHSEHSCLMARRSVVGCCHPAAHPVPPVSHQWKAASSASCCAACSGAAARLLLCRRAACLAICFENEVQARCGDTSCAAGVGCCATVAMAS